MLQPDWKGGTVVRLPGGRFWRHGAETAPGTHTSKTMNTQWVEKLAKLWPGELHVKSPMSKWSTLRVGGPGAAVALPAGMEELRSLMHLLEMFEVDWRVIGKGSNILVSDEGFPGVIIVLGARFSDLSRLEAEEGFVSVRAEAGCSLMGLVNWCSEYQGTGLEFVAGIPGSVGGAVMMNAGAWGSEMSDFISTCTFLNTNGSLEIKKRNELRFVYRSLEEEGTIVVAADFILPLGKRAEIDAKVSEFLRQRKEKQPQGLANAGSFFKNPQGGPAAGKLIEDAGLKGFEIGGARVSEKHANFFVNTGDALAQDFFDLMEHVQAEVVRRSGIMLKPEVHIISKEAA